MSVFKCKMCGGALELTGGESVATCEYCGTQQTLPRLDDERRANLYDRANHFRRNNEFDKAMGIYEQILNEDATDAEAYWSLVLCRYGIEYVEDPATRKRVPTVNRAQFTSVFDDDNYVSALSYADAMQKSVYEAEAKAINEIQKGILAISQKEEPFDVFICYKETDHNGRRTPDSVLATELYHELKEEGFKVFFSRITLEDKLGVAYEPYIFAALQSSKVMVVLGTRAEHFNAVWVKNEWSRYLALIKGGAKKMLIPAYRDMDPYDLPEEFSHLQAQDMAKLGFMQDLVRGIKKILGSTTPAVAKAAPAVPAAPVAATPGTAPLLKRAFMFLEDTDWERADSFCEQVLNLDPERAEAYLGKLMAILQVSSREALKNCERPFDNDSNYKKALRFGDEALRAELEGCTSYIKDRNEKARLARIEAEEQARQARIEADREYKYQKAVKAMNSAKNRWEYSNAGSLFGYVIGYKDADERKKACFEKAQYLKDQEVYQSAVQYIERAYPEPTPADYRHALDILKSIPNFEGAQELAATFTQKREEALAREERRTQLAKRIALIVFLAVVAGIAFAILYGTVIAPNAQYNRAKKLYDAGSYQSAYALLEGVDNHEKSVLLRQKMVNELQQPQSIAAGNYHTVAIKTDGTVLARGQDSSHQCSTYAWSDIVAVSAGAIHTVGLKIDGTVFSVGSNVNHQKDVDTWTDIISVAAGNYHTVGLKMDGTVVAAGDDSYNQSKVSHWTGIVAIAAGGNHTLGLKIDGTVASIGRNVAGQCNTHTWSDIAAIAAGARHTVGLKKDGTVVATGDNAYGQCDVSAWTDMVAIAAGGNCTVGLKKDGTVVAVGENVYQCDVSAWRDIVAIAVGSQHTVGLTKDGTMVAVGINAVGQCSISDWKDLRLP